MLILYRMYANQQYIKTATPQCFLPKIWKAALPSKWPSFMSCKIKFICKQTLSINVGISHTYYILLSSTLWREHEILKQSDWARIFLWSVTQWSAPLRTMYFHISASSLPYSVLSCIEYITIYIAIWLG